MRCWVARWQRLGLVFDLDCTQHLKNQVNGCCRCSREGRSVIQVSGHIRTLQVMHSYLIGCHKAGVKQKCKCQSRDLAGALTLATVLAALMFAFCASRPVKEVKI
jgi:hypothetical protein